MNAEVLSTKNPTISGTIVLWQFCPTTVLQVAEMNVDTVPITAVVVPARSPMARSL